MKKIIFSAFILTIIFTDCVPVNSGFDSARMLHKDQFEVRGNYSRYIYEQKDPKEVFGLDLANNNYGGGIGYGICEKWNLKMRYEEIDFPDHVTPSYQYADVAPKFSIFPNKLAAEIPFGIYFSRGESPTYVASPKLLFSFSSSDQFETTFAAKADLFFLKNESIPLGFNLGFGISSDLNKWAVRPEGGLMFSPGKTGVSLTYGIGFNYNFSIFHR